MSRAESKKQAAPHPFPWRQTFAHFGIGLGILSVSLIVGMWGYGHFEQMGPRDAFLNAAMLLGGMGPVKTDLTPSGKIFAGVYALYAGLVIIALAGLLLGPGVHHLMHHVHWDEKD
ncbi:MAG: hypothetical protein ABI681_09405 [Gemmatimonadales bacterium]